MNTFLRDLSVGQMNEEIICNEFRRHGINVLRTVGKNNFDFYLPDGSSCEAKLDLRSQTTQNAAMEEPMMDKDPDFLIQTLCYAIVLDRPTREQLWHQGQPTHMGTQHYEGRLIPKLLMRQSPYLDQFIKQL